MAHALFQELPSMAKQGADILYRSAVRRLYSSLTGEPATGHPVRLLERLVENGHLTPDAALHLLAFTRALADAGILSGTERTVLGDWRARIESIGRRLFE